MSYLEKSYTGRFAPSPSGPLHFGSLVTAIASYLDAKSNQGEWLLRIDDIDPPREPEGAASSILTTLDQFGLHWDREIVYQSERTDCYQETIEILSGLELVYYCRCTRSQLAGFSVYPGNCQSNIDYQEQTAIRIKMDDGQLLFHDDLQGSFKIDKRQDIGDFIIRRKDRLWAYQLATAIDDTRDQITHVVRGIDLLESSYRQIWLQLLLNKTPPKYAHLPVIVEENGLKLSKQNHAKPVQTLGIYKTLIAAFNILGLPSPPDMEEKDLLPWAISHWDITRLKNKKSLLLPILE